jgi:outer membrane receptor for ferrienterochelin and colicins
VSGSDWAWGARAQYSDFSKYFFLTEVFRSLDLPYFLGAYVEHKNVLGMTVRASVDNIIDSKHRVWRTVYNGFRDRAPIAFVQRNNQVVGPIFSLSIKGNF